MTRAYLEYVLVLVLVSNSCHFTTWSEKNEDKITLPTILVNQAFIDPGWKQRGDYNLSLLDSPGVSIPDELMVYQIEKEKFDEEYLREHAKKIMDISRLKAHYGNPENVTLHSKDGWISICYQGRTTGALDFDTDGYNNPEKYYKPAPKPTNEELAKIARIWLEAKDLIPDGIKFPKYIVYEDVIEDVGVPASTKILSYSVDFIPYANDYPIHGNCHRLLVQMLSGDKRIVHLYRRWLKFKKWRKLKTRSIKDAFEVLNKGRGEVINPKFVGAKARFSRIMYYSQDFVFEYLQPVYYFELDNGQFKQEVKVPALRPEYYKDGLGIRMAWQER